VNEVMHRAGSLDVHVTPYPTDSESGRPAMAASNAFGRRRTAGFVVAAVLLTR
jgi:hypothetical protein